MLSSVHSVRRKDGCQSQGGRVGQGVDLYRLGVGCLGSRVDQISTQDGLLETWRSPSEGGPVKHRRWTSRGWGAGLEGPVLGSWRELLDGLGDTQAWRAMRRSEP